ncbi:MAG: SRPBCC domain-containing protein [Planctomycetes bacterium]|nr:SRPBCC domain-containing protein [Planctomycetota bacterium]
MTTKVLAPHYLRLEREIACDEQTAWRALTDVYELRAWWGQPVCEHKQDVGGGYELRYVGRDRVDTFEYATWDANWRIGGSWQFNWLTGSVQEMVVIVCSERGVRVSIEQTGFESFGQDAARIFGYHKTESNGRLERLQHWCERRLPANMAQMPLI